MDEEEALARLEPGLVRMQRVALDLAAFLRQELAELITLSLQRDQELTLQVQSGERFVIHADEQGLHSLVENLVANAIRHTPEGGQIQVVLERQADGIWLRFQDSGPGIAPASVCRKANRLPAATQHIEVKSSAESPGRSSPARLPCLPAPLASLLLLASASQQDSLACLNSFASTPSG